MKSFAFTLAALLLTFVVQAQWKKTGGPPGITVTKFHDTGQELYVGTTAHGVYRSADHGLHWSAANTGIENKEVLSLESDSLYLYAGTGDEGVFRSADGGASWEAANDSIQNRAVSCLLNAAGYLFAGTIATGIYRSPDHGDTWQDINGGFLNFSYIFSMAYDYNHARLTVEGDNYLFDSYTQGGNWTVNQGTTAFYVINNFLEVGDTLLASAQYGNYFFSPDGGMNWDTVVSVDPDIEILGLGNVGNTLYAGYAMGVYESNDWGQTWTPVPSTGLREGSRMFNGQFAISGPYFLLSFEEIGIYYSENRGLTWEQAITGFEPASNIDNCMLVSDNKLYSGTHTDGVYMSNDEGDTWTKLGSLAEDDTLSNGIIFSLLNPAPDIFLAGLGRHGVYRSADNGASWVHITNGLPVQPFTGELTVNSLVKARANIVTATGEGVFYSSDTGLTWHSTTLTLTGNGRVNANGIADIGDTVCVGLFSTTLQSGVWRSTDGGETWTIASPFISDIVAMTSDGENHFYAGGLSDSYLSGDAGASWQGIGPGINPGAGGFSILAIDSNVFIGNRDGVSFSNDYGAKFNDAVSGLPDYPNHAVQGLAHDSMYIYAGAFRNAVWRRPLADFGIVFLPDTSDTTHNPPDTTHTSIPATYDNNKIHLISAEGKFFITGALPAVAVLNIYDVSGRMILSLKNIAREVDVQSLSSGTYLWEIRKGSTYLGRGKIQTE